MDYFVRLMERLLLLSSYLGDEVINIASIFHRHPEIAQEIVSVIESDFCRKSSGKGGWDRSESF